VPERKLHLERKARRVETLVDAAAPAPYASGVLIVEREEVAMKDARNITLQLDAALS
jgi:hypothetical protein